MICHWELKTKYGEVLKSGQSLMRVDGRVFHTDFGESLVIGKDDTLEFTYSGHERVEDEYENR